MMLQTHCSKRMERQKWRAMGKLAGGTTANGGIAAFTVNAIRETNARREGVTRDMCEECSVLCNR